MRDIPVFTTEYGVASLLLGQVPYWGKAYIRLQATDRPLQLLEECVGFCRACGAEHFYATGHPALEALPLHTSVIRMTGSLDSLPETDAALFPLLPENASQWQQVYNEAMKPVPLASYMTDRELGQLLREGSGYFVHRDGTLLGIGKVAGDRPEAVVSLVPGMGGEIVSALCSLLSGDRVQLEVATENRRAMALYRRLGFLATGEKERWYRV